MAKKKTSAKSSASRGSKASGSGADGGEPQPDFEESLAEIEKIVLQLEAGELSLAESLEKYERAIGRLKQCHQLLDAAERRVTVLAGFDAEGNPVTEPFQELEDQAAGGSGSPEAPRAGRRGVKRASGEEAENGTESSSRERGRVDDSQHLF